jgi:parvulin-like peptidyl-prolyl isomerase
LTTRHTVAHPTRKHLARAERDRRLRIGLLAGTGAVLLAIVGLLGFGWYRVRVVEPRQPVAEVNGEIVSSAAFRGRVLFAQWNLLQQYQSLQQFITFLGGDPQTQQTYQSQLVNLQLQLSDPQTLGQSLLDQMIQEVLIRQEAQRRGIQVSELELDRAFEEAFGYYREGTPTLEPRPSATPTAEPTETPEADETETVAATALPGQATVAPAPTATSASLGSGTPAAQPLVGVEETVDPNATPLPTATPYTLELYQANYADYLSALRVFGVNEATVRAVRQAQLYRERLRESFANQVAPEQEQVWVRHILVSDQALAEQLLGRVQAGEAWEALAAEFSEDESNKDQGGDLGWFARGMMVEPFEQAAFAGEVGQVVGPVQSDFGWHLIEVLGHEVRPLDSDSHERELSRLFNEWLDQATQEAEVVIHDYWVDRLPPPAVAGS